MKPTIVTHVRPHLDEICALWIIQKFWTHFDDCDIEFVRTGPSGGERWQNFEPEENPFVIYVGVGQGKFDEHKGDVDDSAASLVWTETLEKYHVRKGDKEAISRIVEYVKGEDMGQYIKDKNHEFAIPTIISGFYVDNNKDSLAVYGLGRQIMNALYIEMMKRVSAERDWEGRKEFESIWGPAAAVVSDIPGLERIAYEEGFVLVVVHNQAKTFHGFRADPESEVDLTKAALRIEQIEPEADWFLHQSKRMLLCGGEIAKGSRTSELSLDRLADLVKK